MKILEDMVRLFILWTCLLCLACGGTNGPFEFIRGADLVVQDILDDEVRTHEGILRGVNWDRNEAYILTRQDDTHTISIVDLEHNTVVNALHLRRGDSQPPTETANPSHVSYLEGRYYIIDVSEKMLVYDQNLSYLHTVMFKDFMPEHFVKVFSHTGRPHMLIGRYHLDFQGIRCSVEIHEVMDTKRLRRENIHVLRHKLSMDARAYRDRNYILGKLWSSSWGFEKEGKIYFGHGGENRYWVYDIETQLLSGVKPEILKGRRYADEDAEKIVFDIFQQRDMYERLRRRHGSTHKFVAYPDALYHTGIFDIGRDRIGFAGDLDLERMVFRLDIVNIRTHEYEKSIWLPVSSGFLQHLDMTYTGGLDTYINIDKNIHVYTERDPEEGLSFVKIHRFRFAGE